MSSRRDEAIGTSGEDWSAREVVLRQFDRAWRHGPRPALEDYLPEDATRRQGLLVELVYTDLEYRLQEGEPARVEEYLDRFPELRSDPAVQRELLLAELSLRRRRESGPSELTGRLSPDHAAGPDEGEDDPAGSLATRCERCPSCHEPMGPLAAANPGERLACPSCGTVVWIEAARTGRAAPRSRLGKYELLEEVGRGAFGIVFRARDSELDREVAIKVPREGRRAMPLEVDRLLREARNSAHLAHPHIVPVHDSGRVDGIGYIASAFVPSTTLAEHLAARSSGHVENARLLANVAEALQYAHTQGVIHRDIKPSNILIDVRGEPHLTDFGLARRDGATAELTMTVEGDVLGTPAYMSPEQARGESSRVDARADVYSMGVILYEMLTGEIPFRGTGGMIQRQVQEEPPTPPRRFNDRIPRDLETICLKCLEKSPQRRYPSAGALGEDLRAFVERRPIRARPVGIAGRAWRWCRRKPMAAALATVFLAGFAAVTWEWIEARRERARAERNFRLARSTVDDYLTAVSKNAALRRDLPGLQTFRADLLRKALTYYRDFLRDHGRDPSLLDLTVDSSLKAAHILGDIGEEEQAHAVYLEALAHLERLVRVAPDVRDARLQLALAHASLAGLLTRGGHRDQAERHYVAALDGFRQALAARPDDVDARYSLSVNTANLANLQVASGRAEAADASYREALRLQGALAAAHSDLRGMADAEDPDVTRFHNALAHTTTSYGQFLHRRGDLAEAERCFIRAQEIRRGLVAEFPDNIDFRNDLALTLHALASSRSEAGQPGAAENHLAEALGLLEKLVAENPDVVKFQERLGEVSLGLAFLRRDSGRLADVERDLQRAHDLFSRLAASRPDVAAYRSNLALALGQLGMVQHALKREPDAQRSIVRAIAILDSLPVPIEPIELYNRGCLYSLWSGLLPASKGDADAVHPDLAARAVELLRRAIAGGFHEARQLEIDRDLDPLRRRAEFQELVRGLRLAVRPAP